MTDNEIIKALKTCRVSGCSRCPYIRMFPCKEYLANDVLDLINRQKAEIRETRRDLLNEIYALEHQLDTARADAIKEFAERLKYSLFSVSKTTDGHYVHHISGDEIDTLVKEMVGADNG